MGGVKSSGRVWLGSIGCGLGAVLVAGLVAWLAPSSLVYGIVIDAGSSGTRVNVCGLKELPDGRLRLAKFRFEEIKGGLAAVEDVDQALQPLIQIAREEVPEHVRPETAIFLYATAGMRIVDAARAERQLAMARDALRKSGFHFKEHHVSLIEGEDEGIFAWATVNELLNSGGAVGTVDLGGGSIQMTYQAENEAKSTRTMRVSGRTVHVVSHSHLGYGLREYRKLLYGALESRGLLGHNPCVQIDAKVELPVGAGGELQPSIGSGDFDGCVGIMLSTFDFQNMQTGDSCSAGSEKCSLQGVQRPQPKGLFVAFAYLYDTVVSAAGMSEESSLDDIRKRGVDACSDSRDTAPCGDLAYVYTLLKYGLELDGPGIRLEFRQHIDTVMIGWALGALLAQTME